MSPASGGESAHRVASIVVETDKNGRCEERRFDNRSGKIVSATVVDCEARLADEKAIVQALKERGLTVDAVDLAPFRASADKVYAEADMAKAWDAAGLQRVMKA